MSKRGGAVRRVTGSLGVSRSSESAEPAGIPGGPAEVEGSGEINLPRDHPKWLRDRFVVSSTMNALLARLKPAAIRLLGFWDHRIHRLTLEGGTIQIDDSGAYRSV